MIRNSTIIPKKRNLDCGCFGFAFSKNRCKAHATAESTKRRVSQYEESEQDESLQNLISDLDYVFSRFIRLKYADKNGMVECYTSGKKLFWTQMQCGHFIPRANLTTRWMEENCRPQTQYENCNLSGNLKEFRKRLEQERHRLPEWLEEQGREVSRPTRDELKQLIIAYRHKVKMLEKKITKTSQA